MAGQWASPWGKDLGLSDLLSLFLALEEMLLRHFLPKSLKEKGDLKIYEKYKTDSKKMMILDCSLLQFGEWRESESINRCLATEEF